MSSYRIRARSAHSDSNCPCILLAPAILFDAMNPPPSLRDLYIDPNQAWAFVPPTPHASGSAMNNSAPSAAAPDPIAPAYQWSTRPAAKHNSIFDLSPELRDSGFGGGEHAGGAHAAQLFKAFVASAVLQYTSTAIVMPWEVGKLLLQVQWVPRDAGEVDEIEVGEDDNEDAVSAVCTLRGGGCINFCL